MPKASVQIPGSRKMQKVARKFKIGGRKSATGALGLTTEVLVEKFDKARPRDRQKISQIIARRGEDVNVLIAEKAAEDAAQVEA